MINFKFLSFLIFFLLIFIFGFKLLFFFLFILFIFFYKHKKSYYFLLIAYIFLSFLIFDIIAPKLDNFKNDYLIESSFEYEINPYYGYYPKKNSILKDKIFKKGVLQSEIIYTINKFGHRKSYTVKNNLNRCVVFYGGSIIFGQSVNDEESLSYKIFEKSNKKLSTFNFAFNGYGPHQFLSKLENNFTKQLRSCKKIDFIYLYIDDHIGRIAGKRSWGDQSPRYVVNDHGVIQKKFFSHYPYKIIMKFRKHMRNSKTFSLIYDVDKVSMHDQVLFTEIINSIEDKINLKFNNSNFLYLVWDKKKNHNLLVKKFLKNKQFLEIENLNIPDEYQNNKMPGDYHPTKEFYDILSDYILDLIL